MGLAIDIDKIAEVLLTDGWHQVESFTLDAYEFIQRREGKEPIVLYGGAQGGVCSTGATWKEKAGSFYCPLSAILAVRYNPIKETEFLMRRDEYYVSVLGQPPAYRR
jgi:hypothetical protein